MGVCAAVSYICVLPHAQYYYARCGNVLITKTFIAKTTITKTITPSLVEHKLKKKCEYV